MTCDHDHDHWQIVVEFNGFQMIIQTKKALKFTF